MKSTSTRENATVYIMKIRLVVNGNDFCVTREVERIARWLEHA